MEETRSRAAVEYPLGWDRRELDRLRFQHEVWREPAQALWDLAWIRVGDVVLDLGCGPGHASLDLAALVGSRGRVIAFDRSPEFVDHLRAHCEARSLAWIEPRVGTVQELDLADGSVDAVYARWLFCWLEDPAAALERVARCVRPGGAVLVQDYLDWGAMELLPKSPFFRTAVEACLAQWADAGFVIDIGKELPFVAPDCGLRLEWIRPIARIGAVGSPEWRWLGGFFASHLPRVVAGGFLREQEQSEFWSAWERCEADGSGLVCTPTVVDLVLRKE